MVAYHNWASPWVAKSASFSFRNVTSATINHISAEVQDWRAHTRRDWRFDETHTFCPDATLLRRQPSLFRISHARGSANKPSDLVRVVLSLTHVVLITRYMHICVPTCVPSVPCALFLQHRIDPTNLSATFPNV